MASRCLMVAFVAAFLSACAATPQGDFCDVADPIRLNPAVVDAMSDSEVERTLAHNEKGQRLCGWKPNP